MRRSAGEGLTAPKDQMCSHCTVRAVTEWAALAVEHIRGKTPASTQQMKAH